MILSQILSIYFRRAQVGDNIDIEKVVSVDLDKDGHIIVIEILDASKRFSLEELTEVTIGRFLTPAERG
jgi:uncharacterized protein YuzE